MVALKTGVALDETPGSSDFFIEEMINKKLFLELQRGLTKATLLMQDGRPRDTLTELDQMFREVRRKISVESSLTSIFDLGQEVLDHYGKVKSGYRGILTRWPTLNEATMGFWPQDFILYVARVATGKCVTANTELVDPRTGLIHTIEEVYSNPRLGSVFSWSDRMGIHSRPIANKVDTGEKQCFRLTVATGRHIEVTPEHPLLTQQGWQRADQLKSGDRIAIPMRIPFPESCLEIDSSLVQLLGGVLGYACGPGAEFTRLAFNEQFQWEILFCLQESLKGKTVPVDSQKDCILAMGKEGLIRDLFDLFGYDPEVVRGSITIAQDVFRLPPNKLYLFLDSFWGMISDLGHEGPTAYLRTREVTRQLQHLLLRAGVQSRIGGTRRRIDGVDYYTLTIHPVSWKRFAEIYRFWRNDEEIAFRKMLRNSDFVEGLHGPQLMQNEVYFDEILAIEDIGDQKIYDLTVDPTHCFIANDILVHNTWSSIIIAHDAWAMKENKKKVLYVTTELSRARIAARFYAIHLRMPYGQLRKGSLGQLYEARLEGKVQELTGAEGFYIVGGDFDYTLGGLEAAIEKCNPDFVVIDGAYLIKGSGGNRFERAANTFDDLKRLFNRGNIPGLATSQLNRSANPNQKASVSTETIALTDTAAWNTDLCVAMVQTEDMRKDKRMIFKPLKVREGEGEEIECHWNFDEMRFDELPKTPHVGVANPLGDITGDADDGGAPPEPAAQDDYPF
jgi:replicative DNA helicase